MLLGFFIMQRIESVETLKEMGKQVLKEGFDHKIYNYGSDNMFEIFKDTKRYLICVPQDSD